MEFKRMGGANSCNHFIKRIEIQTIHAKYLFIWPFLIFVAFISFLLLLVYLRLYPPIHGP